MSWIQISVAIAAIALGWMWLNWMLRPSISPAAVTDQLAAVTQPLASMLQAVLQRARCIDDEAVRNEAVALAFVATCWGVQMGGGGHMLRQDQCARLSVLFEQRLTGITTPAARRLFFNERYTSYAQSDGQMSVARSADKKALLRQGAEAMMRHFQERSTLQFGDPSDRSRLVDAIAGALGAARDAWAKSVALYRMR